MLQMKDKEKKICCTHPVKDRLGVVGGQAVMEGVMMKHGDRYSLAVRKEPFGYFVNCGYKSLNINFTYEKRI